MFLFIDTTPPKGFDLTILDSRGKKNFHLVQKSFDLPSEKILPKIKRLLKSVHVSPSELGGIGVGTAGSFTALRTGVTIANTLGYVFNIPVVLTSRPGFNRALQEMKKAKTFKPIQPIYDRAPNITQSKKKYL
ncbi:hypothetical protein KJ969_02530 [Patescibacteria group bacterium]|nr:hypothetical protein [Patescibacteria group bacterium]MBU1922502.1 hypothetical protein [Patescibacteria group bacterium]